MIAEFPAVGGIRGTAGALLGNNQFLDRVERTELNQNSFFLICENLSGFVAEGDRGENRLVIFESGGLAAAGFLLPALASRATRSALKAGYQRVTHKPAPLNPAASEINLRDALIWAGVAGAASGMVRLAVRHGLAATTIPAEGHDMDEALIEATDS